MLASYLKIKNVPEFSQANSSLPRYVQGSHQWCWRWGCKWCKCNTKSFDLLNIRAKSLKILAKSLKIWKKFLKIWTSSLKTQAKMAPNVIWIQKMAPNVCRKTHEDLFSKTYIKKDFHDPCGSKYVGNSRTKTYRARFWKFGQKPFESQTFSCSYTSAWAQLGDRYSMPCPPTFFLLFLDFNTKSDVSKRRIRDTSWCDPKLDSATLPADPNVAWCTTRDVIMSSALEAYGQRSKAPMVSDRRRGFHRPDQSLRYGEPVRLV